MAEETVYGLKDPVTSFYDDETGLSVTRDERVTIGSGAGKKTAQMIAKGGLIEVRGTPQPPTGTGPASTERGDLLPDDFPGKDALEAAGYKTLASVKALSAEQLGKVKGVGPKTVEEISQRLK